MTKVLFGLVGKHNCPCDRQEFKLCIAKKTFHPGSAGRATLQNTRSAELKLVIQAANNYGAAKALQNRSSPTCTTSGGLETKPVLREGAHYECEGKNRWKFVTAPETHTQPPWKAPFQRCCTPGGNTSRRFQERAK